MGAAVTARFVLPEPAAAAAPGPQTRPPAPGAKPAAALPLVVLDPGHGGKDPGAIGRGEDMEADNVKALLAI